MDKYNVYEWSNGMWCNLPSNFVGTLEETKEYVKKRYGDIPLKFVKVDFYDVFYLVNDSWNLLDLASAESADDAVYLIRRIYGFNDSVQMKAEKVSK